MAQTNLSKTKIAVVALGVAGWLISYAYFGVYLLEHDWDMLGGWAAAFTANDFATGLLMDLVLTTGMVVALALDARARIGTRWFVAILASLSLSVSIALALYLVAIWTTEPEAAV